MKYKEETYRSIVPVFCGSNSGTAFFVKPDTLLTARHVVIDALVNDIPVSVLCDNVKRVCNVHPIVQDGTPCDIISLTLTEYHNDDYLSLLEIPFDVELRKFVIGYPLEIGLGRDVFDIEIHHSVIVKDREYDVVASPKEIIPFRSYKGFSGSPVLTEEGHVMGLVTDQMNSVIGYSSIKQWANTLKQVGIDTIDNWEEYDTSPYGYASSARQVEIAITNAGDRYSPDLHVDNPTLREDFVSFCSKHVQKNIEGILPSVEAWYLDIRKKYAFIKTGEGENPYKKGDFDKLYPCLYRITEGVRHREEDPNLSEFKNYSSDDYKELKEYSNRLNYYYNIPRDIRECRCALLHGEAGTGKSHFLCDLAKHHDFEYQPYLIFGSQFNIQDDSLSKISELLRFPDGLSGLNDYLNDKGRYAIIIIDAINEGVGLIYWKDEMQKLQRATLRFPNIRFIFSVRMSDSDRAFSSYEGWLFRQIDGFYNTQDAVDKYFEMYGIDNKYQSVVSYEFHNPLFLRIFCVSFYQIPYNRRNNITKWELFVLYLKARNKNITARVDEDPHKNITGRFLYELAYNSLKKSLTFDVPREKAREIGSNICPGRFWRKDLLHACLDENLLIENVTNSDNIDCVEFGFENLGDFLRAIAYLNHSKDAVSLYKWLKNRRDSINRKRVDVNRFTHFVGALLSLKDEKLVVLSDNALKSKIWNSALLDTLQYRGPLNQQIITKFIKESNDSILHFLVRDSDVYSFQEIEALNKTLYGYSMGERDAVWSIKVNELYDWNGRDAFLNNRFKKNVDEEVPEDDLKKAVVLSTWMLTSSYPEFRSILIRQLADIFTDYPEMALFAIDYFHECNDPYVIQGIFCAAYGMSLRAFNAESVSPLAQKIYKMYYAEGANPPADLLVRQWTMKIIERAEYLQPENDIWEKILPPFRPANSPFPLIEDIENIEDNFFGESIGSKKIYDSLIDWGDFNRYIIGTNSRSESSVFVNSESGEAIKLSDIEKMISAKILDLGWTDNLGHLDDKSVHYSRFDNKQERLGKKYQWIAYYDIMGRLTDVCKMKYDFFSRNEGNFRDINYPWYAETYNHFDPSLKHVNNESIGLKISAEKLNRIDAVDANTWINDNSSLPNANLKFWDNKGREWLLVCGYDSAEIDLTSMKLESFVFVNSAFVKSKDTKKFDKWSQKQNYYGRWMPEHSDAIDFLWNEYPWSDSFKNYYDDCDVWECPGNNGCPAELMLSYIEQLQEDRNGFDDSHDFSSSVYMPCPDIMETMGLYTAERGVIRSLKDGNVIAVDSRLVGSAHSGMLFLRSAMDEYLNKTGYSLEYFILGEKMIHNHSGFSRLRELSCSMKYSLEKGLEELSPMKVFDNPKRL